MCALRKGTACKDGLLRSVEVELFSQHGHYTRYLFLLAKTGVLWPGLEVGGHHVVDPCEDLHNLKLLAKLIKNVTEGLDKPGASARVPPGVVTCENKCVRILQYCVSHVTLRAAYLYGFSNSQPLDLSEIDSVLIHPGISFLMSILLAYKTHSLSVKHKNPIHFLKEKTVIKLLLYHCV